MEEVLQQVDRDRIVELASNLANTVSITGEEEEVAKYLGSEFEKLGMQVEYQYVEDGRPNVVGVQISGPRSRHFEATLPCG